MMERLWLRELLCEEFQPWNLTGATASILTGLVSLRSVNAPPPAVITVTSVKIQHELHLWRHTSWFMIDLPKQESADVSVGQLISESQESQGVRGLWTPLIAVSCERSS